MERFGNRRDESQGIGDTRIDFTDFTLLTLGLDDVAERMWTLMAAHGDLAFVEAKLLEEFDVAPDVLARDLGRFVDELVERKLVEVSGDPAGRPLP